MSDEKPTQDDDLLDLVGRLNHSGPRKAGRDDDLRQYNCTYCFDVVLVPVGGYRLCERSACIRHAICDRQTRIEELELEIENARTRLDAEEGLLQDKIGSLREANAAPLVIAQYQSLLKSLKNSSRFHAGNNRVNKILECQRQIEELSAKIPRPVFSDDLRRKIWERDGGICHLCFKEIESWDGAHMELDHVVPRSKGGTDSEDNLRAAHPSCNRMKGDRDLASRKVQAALNEIRKSEAERQKEFLF